MVPVDRAVTVCVGITKAVVQKIVGMDDDPGKVTHTQLFSHLGSAQLGLSHDAGCWVLLEESISRAHKFTLCY